MTAVALGWLLALAVAPVVFWHRALGEILGSFHWSFRYLVSELSPLFMLLAGLVFLVPVALSSGLSPESRLYPRGRRAYIGWGTVLYLIGVALTIQMVEVWSYSH